ncbi:MAG: ABC transporter permease subunit, partial [Clostridiales bacterium]|nr:ABC transporter permease subunit [Clostridiales bacterium]
MKKNTRDKIVKSVCALLGAAAVLLLWQYASENFFERIGVIPSPLKTLETIVGEAAKANFFTAIKNTLWTSVLSFLAAAVPAFVLAAAAHMFPPLKHFLNPFITIARAVPTMAAVIILLLFLGSKQLPIAVGFLVVFPLVYENIYTAFSKVDRELVEMAKSFRVKKGRQITGIYLPAILPYIFS